MRIIGMNTVVLNSIGTMITRVLAVLVLGLLATGDASLVYGQDAATRSYTIVDSQNQTLDIPGMGEQKIETTTTISVDVWKTGDLTYSLKITDFVIDGAQLPGSAVSELIGFESDLVLAEDGTVESASGLAENEAVASIGGDEAFLNRLQSLFLQGPAGDMSVGKTWSRSETTLLIRADSASSVWWNLSIRVLVKKNVTERMSG